MISSRESEVVVLGAGPAGLASAACLAARGVRCRLIDPAGEPGGAYREMYPELTLASPIGLCALPGRPLRHPSPYIRAGDFLAYLRAYAADHGLTVERGAAARVERGGAGFRVALADGAHCEARAVVVATGMWSFPRMPALPGEVAVPVLHSRDWRGAAAAPPGELLVIGGATSAVEIAEQAARAGRSVTLSTRSPLRLTRPTLFGKDVHFLVPLFGRVPTWLARRACARPPTLQPFDQGFGRLRDAGRITVRPALERIEGDEVRFAGGARARIGAVVCATGYAFGTPFLPADVARAPGGHLAARGRESRSWRNLFVMGAPCAGRIFSEFLWGMARDAPALATTIAARRREEAAWARA